MSKGIFFILILVAALLQVTLLDSFKIFGVKPDLLLIGAVLSGLYTPRPKTAPFRVRINCGRLSIPPIGTPEAYSPGGLHFDLKWAFVLSGFCGILKDIFGINTFGINTLLFPLWSFCIIKLSKKISLDNSFICAVLIFIVGIFNSIITRLIFLWLGKFIPVGIFLRIAFLESLYTALISLLVFNSQTSQLLRFAKQSGGDYNLRR